MINNSFTYTICSDERINDTPNQVVYAIDFGGFNSQYNDFYVEVVSCAINEHHDQLSGYMFLACDGLADSGVFCPGILQNSEAIISVIRTNRTSLISNGGISFNVTNARMKRRVFFRMFLSDFEVPVSGTDINVGGETRWILTLKLTPIIN